MLFDFRLKPKSVESLLLKKKAFLFSGSRTFHKFIMFTNSFNQKLKSQKYGKDERQKQSA